MEPLTIIDIFKNLYEIISSSSFFLVCLIISIIFLILLLVGIKKFKKIVSIGFIITFTISLILLIIKYYKYLLSIMDSFIENIFMSIYFPNLTVFIIVLIVSNILLFISLFKDIKPTFYKVFWISSGIIINFLFILILDIVAKNNIDVYTATEVYGNNELYVLLSTSMMIVTINLLFTFITYISKLLIKKKDAKEIIGNKEIEEPSKSQNSIISNANIVPNNIIKDNTNLTNQNIVPNNYINPNQMTNNQVFDTYNYQIPIINNSTNVVAQNNSPLLNNNINNNQNNVDSTKKEEEIEILDIF